jgi:hypothetical protein
MPVAASSSSSSSGDKLDDSKAMAAGWSEDSLRIELSAMLCCAMLFCAVLCVVVYAVCRMPFGVLRVVCDVWCA